MANWEAAQTPLLSPCGGVKVRLHKYITEIKMGDELKDKSTGSCHLTQLYGAFWHLLAQYIFFWLTSLLSSTSLPVAAGCFFGEKGSGLTQCTLNVQRQMTDAQS